MSSSDIINLIIAIVSVVPTIVSVVLLVVNIIKNKNWKLMMAIADEAMKTVEEYSKLHPGMTSDEKLEMATVHMGAQPISHSSFLISNYLN